MLEDTSSKKIKEDKYKILRMSLILGENTDRSNIIEDFKEAAREVDEMNQETYDEGLRKKNYETSNLEEEKIRIESLINYISGRIDQREALIEDFYNVTGQELKDLESITDSFRLEEYKSRFQAIQEYINNTQNIENMKKDIAKVEIDLTKANENKDHSELKNAEYVKTLRQDFIKILPENYKDYKESEIEKEMQLVLNEVGSSKKTLDVFNKAFNSLKNAGISGREEKEYHGYVSNAALDYYSKKEQEFLLDILKLLLDENYEHSHLLENREKIQEIMTERLALRRDLAITTSDALSKLYPVFDSQLEDIKSQQENINNIAKFEEKLAKRQETLEYYEEANRKPEIASILQEFNMIEEEKEEEIPDFTTELTEGIDLEISDYSPSDYYHENEENEENQNSEEVEEETTKTYAPNEIIEFKNATKIDLDQVSENAKKVMLRVGKMLNVNIPAPQQKEEIVEESLPEVRTEEPTIPTPTEVIPNTKENVNYTPNSSPAYELPDLPTVSSLTGNDINMTTETENIDEITSFWGSDSNDAFEFPDINKLEDR